MRPASTGGHWVESIMNWLLRLLALAFLTAVALNLVNVFGRYVLGRTFAWSDTVQVFILIWMTFLGMVVAAWHRRHLRMGLVVQYLPPRVQVLLATVELAVVVAVCGFATWHSVRYTWRSFQLQQNSDVGSIPMWVAHAAVPIGMGMVVLVTLWHACYRREPKL